MSTHSYYGVSITLAGSQSAGSYVNGEPYILLSGATSLTVINNPSHQGFGECLAIGGSMLNPIPLGSQGFTNQYVGSNPLTHIHHYDAAKNVGLQLPINVSPGDMLLVSVARNDPGSKVGTHAIICFSFVSSAPPDGSFRPGFYGTNRTLAFNESQINYGVLKKTPRAGMTSAPSLSYMSDTTRFPALPWFSWGPGWESSVIMPQINTANTAFENTAQSSAGRFGEAALWLNLDYTDAEKRTCLIKILQNGIDLASYFAQGGNLWASGSHQTGYKMPLFFAAIIFNDAGMLAISRNPAFFVEGHLTTWRITSGDVGRSYTYLGTQYYFESGDVGKYWWGIGHYYEPQKDRPPSCPVQDPYYPIYALIFGPLLAARVMGKTSDWGWGAAFHWMEQFIITYGSPGGFFQQFLDTVSPTLPALGTETSPSPKMITPPAMEPGQQAQLMADPWGHPIRFTTNGATPTAGSTLYTAPISLGATATIKARAFPTDGQDESTVASIPVTIITNGTPAPPTNLRFTP